MINKLKYISITIVITGILSGCNSGGSGTSSVLTSYPTSGNYAGSATSSNGGVSTVASGTISGASINFRIVADAIGNITGSFQLNNSTCILGQETLDRYTSSFVATNCSFNNGVLKANYTNGFGDAGSVTLKLQ